MIINMNISMNDRRYENILQNKNTINSRVDSQISFKGGNPLQKTTLSSKYKQIAGKMKLFLVRTFCKPSEFTLNTMSEDIYNMFYFPHRDVDNKKITQIFDMLDIHSKNAEYSEFVKEGIGFLQRVKNAENKDGATRKFYIGIDYDHIKSHDIAPAVDSKGRCLILTIQSVLKKAVKPKANINDEALRNSIKAAKEYMNKIEN